ncbi:MAG: hypothetical protein UV01_C0003G0024 [Parcubacteria group bacterium GW2011_GWA2_42_14]|nr:MAG: hypothetical protein UV01_C0003G0024 [Parcubacteria group bacterium GW2011_GWA2_42_14]
MTAIAAPIIPDAFANIRSSTHICDVVKGFWIICPRTGNGKINVDMPMIISDG